MRMCVCVRVRVRVRVRVCLLFVVLGAILVVYYNSCTTPPPLSLLAEQTMVPPLSAVGVLCDLYVPQENYRA